MLGKKKREEEEVRAFLGKGAEFTGKLMVDGAVRIDGDFKGAIFGSGMLVIGETLPGESARPNWVASIPPDVTSAVKNIFPDLVAGKGGQNVPTPLFLADVNSTLLSQGKLRLVQKVLDGLQNGTISTGVTP